MRSDVNIRINDLVEALVDVPEIDVTRGMRGTVIEVYEDPDREYEVEFVYDGKATPQARVFLPQQIRLLWTSPNGPWHV